MARLVEFKKEDLLEKTIDYIRKNGTQNMTARNVCHYIGCSTQPIFKNYDNFDLYKDDLKKYIHEDYYSFISKYVDKENYLYTISYAYAIYGKKEPNMFFSMFMADLSGSRTIREVLDTDRNMETIVAMTKQYNISLEIAEKVYRDVRFYTHGLATQLCVGSIKLTDKEIEELIKNNIKVNLRGN